MATEDGGGRDGGLPDESGLVAQKTSVEEETRSQPQVLPCTRFYNEWRQCTSAYNRFHQYYIYGQFHPCTDQKERLKKCLKYKVSNSTQARDELLESLRKEQAEMRTPDPVWELRTSPPSDWNKS